MIDTSPQLATLHTAYDLEVVLVRFITSLFTGSRLDSPTLNLAQTGDPGGDDVPPVAYDYTQRAQTLALKVMPQIKRGRIPRTVTGEIVVGTKPDVPQIIVQSVSAHIETLSTIVTVRILVAVYDENPDSQGYQDVINILETLAVALTSFGQGAIEEAYPIVLPIDWKLQPDENTFPHFIGEMTTQWELPSGRPMPDIDPTCPVPVEHLDFRLESSMNGS